MAKDINGQRTPARGSVGHLPAEERARRRAERATGRAYAEVLKEGEPSTAPADPRDPGFDPAFGKSAE